MTLAPHVLVALAITAAGGAGFAANEWTHGGMSEVMGWGHRHMLDDSAWHCGVPAHGHPDGTPPHDDAGCMAAMGAPP